MQRQVRLNGVQLRMRQYRNRPLKEVLAEINGARGYREEKKAKAALERTELPREKQPWYLRLFRISKALAKVS